MAQQQADQDRRRPAGGPGRFSRWVQRRANARTAARIRRRGGTVMGMSVLVLHTVGRRTGQPRETPLAWFDEPGRDGWLVVASGGGDRNPDWFANLAAHADRVAVETHGRPPVPVTPHVLEGPERDRAWQVVAAAQPRIAKYQEKSHRTYPVVRLIPEGPRETR